MWLLAAVARFVLGVLALRGVRWAYLAFVVLGLLYFPAKVGFHFEPHACELRFDLPLALYSLTNYPHIVLFALFFVMTSGQLRMSNRAAFAWAMVATIVMGALVEIAEGVTGQGHCRLRDLIPDAAGGLIGAVLVWLLKRMGWKPHPTWSLLWWRERG